MFEAYIIPSVHIALAGTLFSGVIGIFEPRCAKRAASPWLLALSLVFGAFGALAYLFGGSTERLVVFSWTWFGRFDLVLTHFAGLFFFLLCSVGALAAIFGAKYLSHYTDTYHLPSLHLLLALFIFGMQGVLLADTTLVFFIFWEVMSLASFFLVVADRTSESSRAALLYLVMTHAGAMAILGGFLIVGQGSLQVSLSMLSGAFQALSPWQMTVVFILFLFGFGSKAGLVPMHVWLPEAHPQAPTHVSALMSGIMLKIAVYGFLITAYPISFLIGWAPYVVILLGALSAIFGVLYAAHEKDIKRLLAYSSIENMGLVFMMFGGAQVFMRMDGGTSTMPLTQAGLFLFAFAIFHCVNHAFFKSGLFMSAGAMISATHSRSLEQMGGLAKRMPVFSGVVLCLVLAASALPPFGTFYGEWGFLQSLVGILRTPTSSLGASILAITLLSVTAFVGGMAVFAMIKLFGIGMLGEPRSSEARHAHEPGRGMFVPILITAILALMIGVFSSVVVRVLVGGAPLEHVMESTHAAAGVSLSAWGLSIAFVLILIAVFLVRRILSRAAHERSYQTWNCGQPITAGMEYTATAFASPIRFFFRLVLRTRKSIVTATPVVASNPWIVTRSFSISLRSVWYERLYVPLARVFLRVSNFVRRIQSGRIQFYLLLLLITLFVTLTVAL